MPPLYVIPARGGSKGIPRKNVRKLGPKPLVLHAVDLARSLAPDEDICVSTDSPEILRLVEAAGLPVPFQRPDALATDTAGSYEVLLHALEFYRERGRTFEIMVLLQPTSPFRRRSHVQGCLEAFRPELDMVVSVVRDEASNPYYNLYEENPEGLLERSKSEAFARRQDCPPVYRLNGAVYVINCRSLEQRPLAQFQKIQKFEMDPAYGFELDTPLDWRIAEFLATQPVFDDDYIFS